MKKLLTIIGLAALAVAFTVTAQAAPKDS